MTSEVNGHSLIKKLAVGYPNTRTQVLAIGVLFGYDGASTHP